MGGSAYGMRTFFRLNFEFVSNFDIRISDFPFEDLFEWALVITAPRQKEDIWSTP